MSAEPRLCSPLLARAGFEHGFSTRAADPALEAALAAASARQVHGSRVFWLRGDARPEGEEADALATEEARWVAVRTADCVPVLLADPRGGRVAAVHAGWRGSRARIAARAVDALEAAGARRGDLLAAIGPCIGRCCYEVSAELAERFAADFGAAVRRERHLDLVRVNRITLLGAGLDPSKIQALEVCTRCDERFHSYRRDGADAGRQFSYLRGRPLS